MNSENKSAKAIELSTADNQTDKTPVVAALPRSGYTPSPGSPAMRAAELRTNDRLLAENKELRDVLGQIEEVCAKMGSLVSKYREMVDGYSDDFSNAVVSPNGKATEN